MTFSFINAEIPAPLPYIKCPRPWLSAPSLFTSSPLRPHVAASDHCLHWMTPFGLSRLHALSKHLPHDLVTRERIVLARAVRQKTLSNYGAGLLRFTNFCDGLGIPEDIRMPAPEWLLSTFITTRGAGAVGAGSIKTWLLGLELWHVINGAPWHGGAHLKRAVQGSSAAAPITSSLPKCTPITLAHLKALKEGLNLANTFDTTVFGMATVAFWAQCHVAELCVDSAFDPSLHASHSSRQISGTTVSNVIYHSFWALRTKTCPCGEEIRWTDSCCPCSAIWAFNNHWKINSNVPPSGHLFAFETDTGDFAPMRRQWFIERCHEVWASRGLSTLSGHSFRIGGTTHLLLLGVDPFIVMAQGQWRSTAFLEYWQLCEEIIPTFIGFSMSSQCSLLSMMALFKQHLLSA